jgi:translation initiation factor 5A
MTTDGTAKDDVKVPEGDLGKQIQTGFDEGKELIITVVSAMGEVSKFNQLSTRFIGR